MLICDESTGDGVPLEGPSSQGPSSLMVDLSSRGASTNVGATACDVVDLASIVALSSLKIKGPE